MSEVFSLKKKSHVRHHDLVDYYGICVWADHGYVLIIVVTLSIFSSFRMFTCHARVLHHHGRTGSGFYSRIYEALPTCFVGFLLQFVVLCSLSYFVKLSTVFITICHRFLFNMFFYPFRIFRFFFQPQKCQTICVLL